MSSKLFVRDDRPEALDQALGTSTDMVDIDLEDTVLPVIKVEVCAAVTRPAKGLPSETFATLLVRVNGAQSGLLRGELEALVRTSITLITQVNHIKHI